MKTRMILLLALFLLLPMASAEIFLSQTEPSYSIGDRLDVDISLSPPSPTNDFLSVNIACSTESVNIYRNPVNLIANEDRTIPVNVVLSKTLIGSLEGDCQLNALYGSETASSNDFRISDDIDVELDLFDRRVDPASQVTISGTAVKVGDVNVEGFVEVRIDSLGVSVSKPVNQGEFSFNFTIPRDAASGEHEMSVRVYEQDPSGELSNEGTVNETIEVAQVLNRLEIEVSSQNAIPGEEGFTYQINAFDQADSTIDTEVSVYVYDPAEYIYSNRVIRTQEEYPLLLNISDPPGYWKIEASSDGIDTRKLFYLEEIRQILSTLLNDTLIVTNTGNTPYQGPIEISIGSAVEVRQLDLAIGETKRYRLTAPDGTYLIRINDGTEETVLGNVALTGNAVGVDDIKGGLVNSFVSPIFWLMGILLLGLIIAYVIVKRKVSKGMSLRPKIFNRDNSPVKKPVAAPGMAIAKIPSANIASTGGSKEVASAVALKINANLNSQYVDYTLNNILALAKKSSAKIYVDEDYRIILFAPSLTKTKNNEMLAIRVAKRIEEMLNSHNKKYNEKINFGIAVNVGEIISEMNNGEFSFTTVKGVISKAKRISQEMRGETILSDEIRRMVINEVKTELVSEGEWRIVSITDRSQYQGFVNKFVNRNNGN